MSSNYIPCPKRKCGGTLVDDDFDKDRFVCTLCSRHFRKSNLKEIKPKLDKYPQRLKRGEYHAYKAITGDDKDSDS